MKYANVKLILSREIRDQLRDRRTLFVIFVLPVLLYPLLGTTLMQMSQFLRERPTKIWVVGEMRSRDLPPLFVNDKFADELFLDADRSRLLELTFASVESKKQKNVNPIAKKDSEKKAAAQQTEKTPFDEATEKVKSGEYDAALYFPPDFTKRIREFGESVRRATSRSENADETAAEKKLPQVPNPEIVYTTANEKSQIAFARLSEVLHNWTENVGKQNLEANGLSRETMRPFVLDKKDLAAESGRRGAAVWAKILPMLLILWALTGAFYPAIDLCAGEKERGTLETLLCSPATRSEIVIGKLITVALFSSITALLNLASLGLTGLSVLHSLPGLVLPSHYSILWLVISLIPISALFSALCIALAALARSSKEGQYYLMPLLLIVMPLVMLPMSPGVELNLGNSLIPVTGIVLLLRSLMEGNYLSTLQYLPVVFGVTAVACALAIRWAVDQFNSESVLFRESERIDIGVWLRHLLRDKEDTPSVAGAVFCGVIILTARFYMNFAAAPPDNFRQVAISILATQLAVILTPTLLMAIVMTKNVRKTLLCNPPSFQSLFAALCLAITLHPAMIWLQTVVGKLYPISENAMGVLGKMQQIFNDAPIGWLIFVISFVPAVCEELAFRGFVLSGFRHVGYKWRAIAFSAFFFGVTHGIVQQSLIACIVGVVIGFIAVQSGSIFPCMLYHFAHNALAMLNSRITPELCKEWPILNVFIEQQESGGHVYPWQLTVFCGIVAAAILLWFGTLSYAKSSEETLQDSIKNGEPPDEEGEAISSSLASLIK